MGEVEINSLPVMAGQKRVFALDVPAIHVLASHERK